ncbi:MULTISPECIES: hypothetical protein [Aeromonas]|uniref:hypothetical protein n=1 Tax=Aeromonas TaxID=642 RepID=UPI00145518A3|nr:MULTISPECIES: hypothetical protein [Aeromonas]MBQ4667432.1 hypothetical protein [Aeromonas hydrophila]MBQ4714205.1 hypothetical protein [Aeromonas hydrophila]MBW3822621.1 hypothetical protein [Aeromonas hydrophila]MBW5269147.1 hypothetical protein [Aeromonas hydrophila]NLR34628.1 hypothetical protein [Aeromonas hydrophila]
MTNRLLNLLGSYPKCDEFQIGRLLIWVEYPSGKNRVACLRNAEEILPELESDISRVEELAAISIGSSVPATVAGIRIEADRSASYECTFFDGEHEDEFITIRRDSGGYLFAEAQGKSAG